MAAGHGRGEDGAVVESAQPSVVVALPEVLPGRPQQGSFCVPAVEGIGGRACGVPARRNHEVEEIRTLLRRPRLYHLGAGNKTWLRLSWSAVARSPRARTKRSRTGTGRPSSVVLVAAV